jgi:hypothetical protein
MGDVIPNPEDPAPIHWHRRLAPLYPDTFTFHNLRLVSQAIADPRPTPEQLGQPLANRQTQTAVVIRLPRLSDRYAAGVARVGRAMVSTSS